MKKSSTRYANIGDLFKLSAEARDILLYLARNGPSTLSVLARNTGLQNSDIRKKLTYLEEKGRIQTLPEGKYKAALGRVAGHTELPLHLLRVLGASGRLYSERDIVTLRVAIPILQFARSRLVQYADHGPNHALRVKSFAGQLARVMALSDLEQELLRAACLFHDVGNAVDRQQHHLISQQTVEKLAQTGELPFNRQEAETIGLLCRWHRGEYDSSRCTELNGVSVRVGLLASILRVADAMDIDHRRSDYTERFARVLRMFYPDRLPYWTSLEEILGVRIHCSTALELQVFSRGKIKDNIQIDMLRKDLASTPLDWRIQEIASSEQASGPPARPPRTGAGGRRSVLLAFAFEPHSLIMAALSRVHLKQAGYAVEPLCFPDVSGYAKQLWGSIIPGFRPQEYTRLIVTGDRPEPTAGLQVMKTLSLWRAAGTPVTLLNRHEACWSRFPALLEHGVEVILGGDWAYFWGEQASQRDLWWGLIAALCTRDPTLSILGIGEEETQVSRGLIKSVYELSLGEDDSAEDLTRRANLLLDRIQADDRLYFRQQATGFREAFTHSLEEVKIQGKVIRCAQASGTPSCACYWAMEAAIERSRRAPVRGISFNNPYCMSTRRAGGSVELLAINHWRDEETIPIRLLYPYHLGPTPTGNESMIQVSLPATRAEVVVRTLLEVCNDD